MMELALAAKSYITASMKEPTPPVKKRMMSLGVKASQKYLTRGPREE